MKAVDILSEALMRELSNTPRDEMRMVSGTRVERYMVPEVVMKKNYDES